MIFSGFRCTCHCDRDAAQLWINILLSFCFWIPAVLHAWYMIYRGDANERAAKDMNHRGDASGRAAKDRKASKVAVDV